MTKTKTKVDEDSTKPKRTLYEISSDYTHLEALLESIDGDISADDQTKINEFLQGLEEDRDKKIDAYCGLIRELEARGKVRKEEGTRLNKLGKVLENKVKRLKWCLLNFLQTHSVEKIETDFNVVRRTANASAPVVLSKHFQDHPEELEERFRTVTFTPNLTEIAQALKDGEKLDFAQFGEKGENLKIS